LITIRRTLQTDWARLKTIRLAALCDSPTAFGVSHEQALLQTDAEWRARAAGGSPAYWLAFEQDDPLGMIGGVVSAAGRYNLIGMWVTGSARGSGVAAQLVDVVKAHATGMGHAQVYLDVSPENTRAARFYQKHGFSFIDEWEALGSHPHIQVQTMVWQSACAEKD
jgi:ribosomal protein S18 acetylase RimI-like enzyme